MTHHDTPSTHPDVQERLVRTHQWHERARTALAVFTSAVMLFIGLTIVVMLLEARDGRAEIRDCINPNGACAQRGAEQGQDLIAASIVCSQRNLTTKQQAIACVKEVLAP